ncbi:hypothetical protein CANARDRAFT_27338 [[Candida] arabinofermentans NRRL YB-2248]|uniref:Cx9C motif-containing protein 4, mitochondrial n=1 Tax=[Candida] arabinofermentans NRRL YB-2248 TaxID=983967 RepID=A0A1E4T5J5_9ASCO|nr:hypothetical protein CANARDRAFT_27338 [[Candida] arabinofermentans NRRL YB-2248]
MSSCNTDPCKAEACKIQDCLKGNNYDESKCTKVIDNLYKCCTQFYEKNGTDARSVCCPIPRLLEFKIEQRKKEMVDAKMMNWK